MKNFPIVPILLLSLAAAGCQGNPQVRRVVDSVQAENRQLEDFVYLLEQDIQVLEQENHKLRRQIERGASGAGSSGTRRGGTLPRREENPELTPPVVEGLPEVPMPEPTLPQPRPAAPRPLNKPELPADPDLGPLLEPPVKKPTNEPAGSVKPMRHEQSDGEPRTVRASSLKKPEPEVTDKVVTHLHLNPLHTCGLGFDQAPGDDGLSILLEPRNEANQYVPLAGPVSVVVLDPSKNGDDARVARWDFSSALTAEKFAQGAIMGIQLKLPWPGKPPESAKLEVFVRYETPEGKKLQAEKEIFIALAGQFSQRWTPRPADRQRKPRSETIAAGASESNVAAVPPRPAAIESPAEMETEDKPAPLVPPAGLSERQTGEKPAKPKWAPTR